MILATTASGTEYLINVELMQYRRLPDPRSDHYQAFPKDGYMSQYLTLETIAPGGASWAEVDDESQIEVGQVMRLSFGSSRDIPWIRSTAIVSIDVLGGH